MLEWSGVKWRVEGTDQSPAATERRRRDASQSGRTAIFWLKMYHYGEMDKITSSPSRR